MRSLRYSLFFFGALIALLALPEGGYAQRVGAVVSPDSVLVGDVFRAAIRVELPPGHRAIFPDTIPVPEDVEQAGRREEFVEERDDGSRRLTVVYPMSAWRPGPVELPAVPVRLEGPDGERTLEAQVPGLVVHSVLPPDSAELDPRGLKDVLGASRTWWPLLLALLLGGVAAAGGVWYWRRRGGETPIPIVPPIPPRERALAELERARRLGLLEAGELKAFYSIVTGAVRGYLAALNTAWGAELTTTELLERTDRTLQPESAHALAALLHAGDYVKFAKGRRTHVEAEADWEAARAWVLAHGRPTPDEPEEPEESVESATPTGTAEVTEEAP